MAVQQVEVVGPEAGLPVDWVHMHAELVEWQQVLTYAIVAFGAVLLLVLVALLVVGVVRR